MDFEINKPGETNLNKFPQDNSNYYNNNIGNEENFQNNNLINQDNDL